MSRQVISLDVSTMTRRGEKRINGRRKGPGT
jgi:hypothetical protein